ncbi:MAG: CPBP family intramembrane metalloprotease [Armatimonadota bacterium]|nr:CPBP family intramembrane metalloprotease [Armatimonadota bacterium]
MCVEEHQVTESQVSEKEVWGPWPTAGLGCAVFAAFIVVQTVVGIVFVAAHLASNPKADFIEFSARLASNGLLVSVMTFATTLVGLCLVVLFTTLRKSVSVKDYLGLHPISFKTFLAALGVTAALVVLSDGLLIALNRPTVPQWQIDVYRTSVFPFLLWIAIILVGPAFEETFFRGFLLEGFRRSSMGNAGAVALTSLLWALIHVQYGFIEIAMTFVGGLILGAARLRTRSLWTCYAMHGFMNLVATVETVVRFQR